MGYVPNGVGSTTLTTTVFINALDIFGDFGVVLIEEAGLVGTPNFDITPMQ